MQITAIQCQKCLDVLISLHRHDFHGCTCGDVAVDGGRDYLRISYTKVPPPNIHINFNGLNKDLKFGIMKQLMPLDSNTIYDLSEDCQRLTSSSQSIEDYKKEAEEAHTRALERENQAIKDPRHGWYRR